MKIPAVVKSVILGILLGLMAAPVQAEDKELEKRQNNAIEKFMISARESEGDFSTISLRNWKSDIGVPFLTLDTLLRKMLSLFEEHYKNLDIVSFQIIYYTKPGPSSNSEPDFLIIHHRTKPKKTYRFETNKDE